MSDPVCALVGWPHFQCNEVATHSAIVNVKATGDDVVSDQQLLCAAHAQARTFNAIDYGVHITCDPLTPTEHEWVDQEDE